MSIKPITQTLALLQGGLFLDRCSDLFGQIVRSVDETGKAGRLTITLDIKKTSGAISVLAKATDKTPEAAPDADLFYATVEGNLSRNNPKQRELPLRSIDEEPREPARQVDQARQDIRSA